MKRLLLLCCLILTLTAFSQASLNPPPKTMFDYHDFNVELLMEAAKYYSIKDTVAEKKAIAMLEFMLNSIDYQRYYDRIFKAGPEIAKIKYEGYLYGKLYGDYLGDSIGFHQELRYLGQATLDSLRKIGVGVDYLFSDYSHQLEADHFISLLGTIPKHKKDNAIRRNYFGHFLKDIHYHFLTEINKQLGCGPEDFEYAQERYDQLHPILTEIVYHSFLQIEYSKNYNYRPEFTTYNHYHAVQSLGLVLRATMPFMADAIYTYVYQDWGKVTAAGFKVDGKVTDYIQKDVIPYYIKMLTTSAIRKDYDGQLGHLEKELIHVLGPLRLATRSHKKGVGESFNPSRNYVAGIDMEITTLITLGLDTDDISVSIDHRKKEFTVELSTNPRLLDLVFQDYKVTKVSQHVIGKCKFLSSKKKQGGFHLSSGLITSMFNINKDEPSQLSIAKTPFARGQLLNLIPTIQKVFEPALTLSGSCYQLRIIIDGWII